MNSALLLTLALLGLCCGVSAQSCWVEGHQGESTITLPPLSEDTPASTSIATFQLVNHLSTATVSDPFTKYLSALRYANGIYIISTTDAFPGFVTTERVTELSRTFSMTCADGTVVRTTLVFPIPDLNNHAPTWNEDSYDVSIALPLNPTVNHTLIRTTIVASDGDVDQDNADVYITSSSRNFLASITPSTGAASYDWKVDFLVDVTISPGNYMTMLTADDGTHFTTAIVRFTVLPPGDPEPEPTEAPVTEEPTEEPTDEPTEEPTEVPEVTTEDPVVTDAPVTDGPVTDGPVTDEPVTEEPEEPETPEPEPTLPAPSTTTTTTTTTTERTTPAPTHTCGLTGLSPDNSWGLAEPLHPGLPSGTEIWRHPLYNVVSTTAVNHPHNKYISAYRGSLTYWFTTNDFYQSFIEEQGTNIIERRVNFYCEDGSVVQYHFMLEIDNTPIEEDTLPPLFKVWA